MKALYVIPLAAAVTFGLVTAVAFVALRLTGVPRTFPPFTPLPLLSGVVGGFLGASLVYLAMRQLSPNPNRTFLLVALVTLALSFGLPMRLSFTKSSRFAGVTPAAQMTLALLHTIIATAAVTTLTALQKP